jgi:hypothetical protein
MATSHIANVEAAFRFYNGLNQRNGRTLQIHAQLNPMIMENEYAITDWDANQAKLVLVAGGLTLEGLISLLKLTQADHPLLE